MSEWTYKPFLINEYFITRKMTAETLDSVLANGWRHFGTYFFRYNVNFYQGQFCNVIPLRVDLQKFTLSKNQKKIWKKNQDLSVLVQPIQITQNVLDLFEKHKVKFKENMPESIYTFLSTNPAKVPCPAIEVGVYQADKLVAMSFLDVGKEAVSSIYGMYDFALANRSLGIYTMLLEIDFAVKTNCRYYYHGYCFDIPSFYDYKKKFKGLQGFDWRGSWNDL